MKRNTEQMKQVHHKHSEANSAAEEVAGDVQEHNRDIQEQEHGEVDKRENDKGSNLNYAANNEDSSELEDLNSLEQNYSSRIAIDEFDQLLLTFELPFENESGF
jgi:hypothetical protein